jgi:hypothetical protein
MYTLPTTPRPPATVNAPLVVEALAVVTGMYTPEVVQRMLSASLSVSSRPPVYPLNARPSIVLSYRMMWLASKPPVPVLALRYRTPELGVPVVIVPPPNLGSARVLA